MGEDIPFTTFVDLPGVNPGDSINIHPIVEHIGFELKEPIGCDDDSDDDVSDCSDFDPCDPYVEEPTLRIFRRLIQRTVIQLNVRGSAEQAIRVATAPLPAVVTASVGT